MSLEWACMDEIQDLDEDVDENVNITQICEARFAIFWFSDFSLENPFASLSLLHIGLQHTAYSLVYLRENI